MVYRNDRKQVSGRLHHERVVLIGHALREYLKWFPPFESYEEFLDWAGEIVGVGGPAVGYSLKKRKVYRKGTSGSKGGPQFEEMLDDIMAYANSWEVE